jgi:hypothetical protein
MKYSDWYRATRKAEQAYRAACKRGKARAAGNPGPVSARLAACARACDKAYLRWVAEREKLKLVTVWDD